MTSNRTRIFPMFAALVGLAAVGCGTRPIDTTQSDTEALRQAYEACRDEALREAMHRCIEAGGTEESCRQTLGETSDALIRDRCAPPPDSSSVSTCEHHCLDVAASRRDLCLREGGSEEECRRVLHSSYETCVRERCEAPPPPEPTCEDRCKAAANEARHLCAERGGTPEECERVFRAKLDECVRTHCAPPPDRTCQENCEQAAVEHKRACLAEGVAEEECAARARHFYENCVNERCAPPPEPTCEDRCRAAAAEAKRQCTERGGSLEECEGVFRTKFEECVHATCNVQPPPEPTCEDRCRAAAAEAKRQCTEHGGTLEECERVFRAKFEECVQNSCVEPPPPGPTCEQNCEQVAAEKKRLCLEEGVGEEECAARARNFYNACVHERCAPPPPPPEPTCADRCEAAAGEKRRMCIAEGNPENVCDTRTREFLHVCLAECPQ